MVLNSNITRFPQSTMNISMQETNEVTNKTLDTDTEFVSYSILICSVMGISAITSNLFTILGIGTVQELLTKSNIEIINLAMADLSTGAVMLLYSFFLVRLYSTFLAHSEKKGTEIVPLGALFACP